MLKTCPHIGAVYVNTGGWTLDADKSSPYYGTWIHAHPDCMKPRHFEEWE